MHIKEKEKETQKEEALCVFYLSIERMSSRENKVRIAEVALRGVVFGFGLVSALLIATDSQVRTIFSVEKKARFTDMKALV